MVTNDDGVEAPGLLALVRALHVEGYQIEVAGPLRDHSGSGSSIGTLDDGAAIAYEESRIEDLPDVRVIGFDAPPSFAVLAMRTGTFGAVPDLIVSGINPGHNTGRLVLNSSTVGAALTAVSTGARAIAISCGFAPTHRFDTAAAVAVAAVRWMVDHGSPRTLLNLNVPDLDLSALRGVRSTVLAPRSLMGLTLERRADAVHLRRFNNTEKLGVGTDSAAVIADYVALTALQSVTSDASADVSEAVRAIEEALVPVVAAVSPSAE
ncbi:5'/3'-nucleotidase SurE [Nocardia jiangxiensis]|uniref:5'-nucleotidase n=1 Tax=Nocardia jiangxiensis TaxID=282685 RepID=A0ABW6SCT5_9NOCA|nr:5'/3'-nucleotidase SurE [Nocardia jiangxiensis]